jgi:7-keto-8-aminopelargonate synthetase-like enzyme
VVCWGVRYLGSYLLGGEDFCMQVGSSANPMLLSQYTQARMAASSKAALTIQPDSPTHNFCMQVDAHMDFEDEWDMRLLEMWGASTNTTKG